MHTLQSKEDKFCYYTMYMQFLEDHEFIRLIAVHCYLVSTYF